MTITMLGNLAAIYAADAIGKAISGLEASLKVVVDETKLPPQTREYFNRLESEQREAIAQLAALRAAIHGRAFDAFKEGMP